MQLEKELRVQQEELSQAKSMINIHNRSMIDSGSKSQLQLLRNETDNLKYILNLRDQEIDEKSKLLSELETEIELHKSRESEWRSVHVEFSKSQIIVSELETTVSELEDDLKASKLKEEGQANALEELKQQFKLVESEKNRIESTARAQEAQIRLNQKEN